MNERIRQLADQANLYARSDNSSMLFENYHNRYTEKFAELIVRECARIAFDKSDHADLDAYKLGRKWASEDVLKHFGVEE